MDETGWWSTSGVTNSIRVKIVQEITTWLKMHLATTMSTFNFFNKRFIVSYLLTWERNDIKMQLFWRVNVSPMVSVSPFCVKVEPFPPSFVGLPSLTIFFRWVDWRFHFHRKQFPFNEFEQFDEISVLQVCLCFNFFKKANKLCFDTNARLMNALSPLKIWFFY